MDRVSSNGNRTSTWLTVIIVGAGALVATIVATVSYLRGIPPLHPDAQQVSSVAGVASPAWKDTIDKARQLARAGISEQNLPGLSVAVGLSGDGRAGEVIWSEGFGWADIETRTLVGPGTRFRIGHASNALTSAAAGLLRDKGRLHFDDEIQTYVPSFPRKPWPVTVRQLMGHLAGIRHYSGEEADIPSGHCERAVEGVKGFADDPLLFEPETQSRYSTYGWVLVSAAIEAAADQPFFTFMQTQIFAPLGMTDTMPDPGDAATDNRATAYFPRFSGDNQFGQQVGRPVDYSCFAGAGAFLSTPTDLVRFAIGLNAGNLLRRDTVRMLQTPQTLASGQETEFGLGWMLERLPLAGDTTPVAGHASRSLIGGSTSFLTFPERGLIVAVTSNTSYAGTRAIALSIAQVFAEQMKISGRK